MGILDNFLNRAKSVAQTTGKKASELLEATKLNLSISELQTEIDNVMKEMGRIIYQHYEDQMDTDEELASKCAIIEEKYAQIKELKDKVNLVKNLINCPNCGEPNPASSAFCQNCGSKLEDQEQTFETEESYVEADLDDVREETEEKV